MSKDELERPRVTRAMIGLASEATAALLGLAGPADETLSRYFRAHRSLGRRERAFVAEAAYAVLRRRRSLEAAARSSEPRALVLCALVRILGYSARSLDSAIAREELVFVAQLRSVPLDNLSPAVRADLPDWLWERLVAEQGEEEAARIAAGLLQPAPLDLRVNIARTTREEALQRLRDDGLQAVPTPHSPAGLRLPGKPAINRHPLFVDGLIEVQDEGSQLLAWLVAPRRGEMIADYCAGAGGKTLALAMLMRASGRVYAMDVSAKRLSALSPRAARARVTSIHPLVLSGENDTRAKRLAGKLDRVLVDAPCSGFGTLRRNPDLKWRHGPDAVRELAAKQQAILRAASRLVKRGGRLVYATCSILREENEAVVDAFVAAHPQFAPESCGDLLSAQKIAMEAEERLRLWPHVHGTDGFFAAAFRRET